jgi:hypothetical protein
MPTFIGWVGANGGRTMPPGFSALTGFSALGLNALFLVDQGNFNLFPLAALPALVHSVVLTRLCT